LQIYGTTVEFYVDGKKVSRPITLDSWHYVVGTFDGTTVRLSVDAGTPATAPTTALNWPTQSMFLGDRVDHVRRYKGFLDEVRLSNVPRSSAWIAAEYNNQLNPSTFLAIGTEESFT
jgi:hypothetical protein